MNDEIAPAAPPIPAPGVSMPTPIKHKHPRRNAQPKAKAKAKAKHAAPRYRNAGPPPPRSAGPRKAPSPELTMKDKLVHLAETLGGAGLTSVIGAYAVKWGLHPELVSTGLGIAGGYFSLSPHEFRRFAGVGAASAAGSQLLLLKLNPAPIAPKGAAQPASPPPTQTAQQLPRPKNADLGSLPPGMLDAAFERARADLAVAGDGYPASYEHGPHHFHHGPVYPSE
jgi:hypothetical protein